MRSMPTPVAMSSVPLSVTPLRKLLPLLKATSAPVPVVAIVPPLIVLPNWLMTLPTPTFITPPALLMLCPAETPRFAVTALPTLMTPVLAVLPPPTRLRPKASMLIWPALFRFSTDCPVLIVTTPAAPMLAVSLPPGDCAGLPLPAAQASQLAMAFQLPAAAFQVQVAAAAGATAKGPSALAAASASAVRPRGRRKEERGWLGMMRLPGRRRCRPRGGGARMHRRLAEHH